MQQIPISHAFDSYESKSKDILAEKILSKVCSTDEGESESIIVDESSMEESESEIVHKRINRNEENGAIDQT